MCIVISPTAALTQSSRRLVPLLFRDVWLVLCPCRAIPALQNAVPAVSSDVDDLGPKTPLGTLTSMLGELRLHAPKAVSRL